MAGPSPVKTVIASDLAEAARVVGDIMSLVESRGFNENARFAIRLALDEAMANAIRHGNDSDINKTVAIEYACDETAFTISICDEGVGFDPDALPDPTLEENLERPHGRGVMLMRAYMTEVDFNPAGNCVRMVKRADCRLPLTDDD